MNQVTAAPPKPAAAALSPRPESRQIRDLRAMKMCLHALAEEAVEKGYDDLARFIGLAAQAAHEAQEALNNS